MPSLLAAVHCIEEYRIVVVAELRLRKVFGVGLHADDFIYEIIGSKNFIQYPSH